MSRNVDVAICLKCVNFPVKKIPCSHDGKVRLPNMREAPDLFKELLCSNSQDAKNYSQQIREYKAALALASMGAEIKAPPGTIYSALQPLASSALSNES
ncbi:hypothetical protein AVEN_187607-1 [Araneus ventricosus]|uniref:Uncharacterized protein n=1 Tax=Araneus ventricosus TaxID=182803 RepID=A0A4Y2S244_ARAVE|nr:hypothetical protein AVEN_187607-1 [Araneus ventricosus]